MWVACAFYHQCLIYSLEKWFGYGIFTLVIFIQNTLITYEYYYTLFLKLHFEVCFINRKANKGFFVTFKTCFIACFCDCTFRKSFISLHFIS